jgi:RND superfamily putative drug exporter
LINAVRKVPAPFKVLVGGAAADFTDSQAGIARTLPWALGWIALTVLILLFMFTGSIILPIKAVILNVLSLGATMGLLTWIFVDGHMTWLVGSFTKTGTIDTSMVILISVVTFGLSMDYEVFLLSRIKEEHDAGRSNVDAVATGLQRSARIITAAALLLAVVFAVFLTSGVTSIKTLGFGVAFAILLDATLVRALLVPALMRLFGERNWWAPRAMKRFAIGH